jgi:hypothetical protein
MSKPKNPKMSDYAWAWYAAGLADGEKRLARALKRWLGEWDSSGLQVWKIKNWLTAQTKLRRGR